MKKKLISVAVSIGIFIILAVAITGVILIFKKNVNVDVQKQGKHFYPEDIKIAFDKGDLDDAILKAEKLVSQDDENVEALLTLASTYLQKGSLSFREVEYGKKALEVVGRALTINDSSDQGHFIKGYAYEIMEDYKKALESYDRALELRVSTEVYNQIGHVYDLMGNDEGSIEFYDKALEMDSQSVHARMNLARNNFENGERNDSLKGFEYVYEQTENNHLKAEAAYMMGFIALENEDIEKAEGYMNESTTLSPDFPTAWMGMGQVLLARVMISEENFEKNIQQVIDYFDKAIELNNSQTMAYLLKARVLVLTGNKEEAADVYFKALEIVDVDITLMNSGKINLKKVIKDEIEIYEFVKEKVSLWGVPMANARVWIRTSGSYANFIAQVNAQRNDGRGHAWSVSGNVAVCANGWGLIFTCTVRSGAYSSCSRSCGGGVRWRNNACTGQRQVVACNTHSCCSPSWGSYGSCSTSCGNGTQTRSDGCGGSSTRACNNGPCPACGSSNEKSYEKTSEVVSTDVNGNITDSKNTCATNSVVSNWVDNSGLTGAGGKAWTWKCNRTRSSVDCLAYKLGKCASDATSIPMVTPPYDTKESACSFGAFNSVRLVGGILHWQCGTGNSNKKVGSFFFNNRSAGSLVPVDYYGVKAGGVDCQCTPIYKYDCVNLGTYTGSCANNCGGTIRGDVQAIKRDVACFVNESLLITEDEYLAATGKHCSRKVIQCAPCGAQNSNGGIYHETN
jgi:tetratricopeptide (TPR) repeat protein